MLRQCDRFVSALVAFARAAFIGVPDRHGALANFDAGALVNLLFAGLLFN
jgi:hypothetical protein